jgi:micrococcal nuclease
MVAVIIILALCHAPECCSCECGDTRAASCFRQASMIFEGEVASMQIRAHALFEGMTPTKRSITEYTVFTLKVGRVYKGTPSKFVRVATGIGTADGSAAPDCSFPFEIGQKYLVYGLAGIRESGGLLYTNICVGTNRMEEAGLNLRHLQGKPPTQEDKLVEKRDFSGLSKLYASRQTAQISGKIDGKIEDKKAYLHSGLWRLKDGEWKEIYSFCQIAGNKYTFPHLEPGNYRIGFYQVVANQRRKIGFYGGGERLSEAKTVVVGPKTQVTGLDVKLVPQSHHTIRGTIECIGGLSPKGKIRLRVANSWDRNNTSIAQVKPCGPFQIPDAYSGIFRVIGTIEPDDIGPLDAWTIDVPEIVVPEKADNVIIRLKHERLSERSTSPNYIMQDAWTGTVYQVLDGDKVLLQMDGDDFRLVRIADIDCPDKGQDGWEEAKLFTARQLLGKKVTFFILQNESSKTPLQYEDAQGIGIGLPTEIAHVLVEGLLRSGLAWHYKKYSAHPDLAQLETEARKAKRGIWSRPNPIPPWDYRKIQHHEP